MSSNLALNLTGTATARGQSQALRLADVVVSYAGLNEATARFAGLLRERGVGLGDRVGIMLPNVPYFAVAYYGVLRAGGAVVPMSVLLKQREVAFYLGDPEAKLVFAWHEFAEPAQAGAAQADAECVIVAPGEFEQLLATIDPVTVFEGVPTMYSALLHHPERDKFDVSSLNVCAPVERRCRLRSYAASRRRLAARCSKATGCLRPPRSGRSTRPIASAGRARSGFRCRAWRCGSSTSNGTLWRRARWARSQSAERTS